MLAVLGFISVEPQHGAIGFSNQPLVLIFNFTFNVSAMTAFIDDFSFGAQQSGPNRSKEVNFKNSKNYQSRLHLGKIEINNTNCACVVKKWPYIGENYMKFVANKGYEFDQSKHCIIETKIGKTISRSTIIHVSYFECIDGCPNIKNAEGENLEIVQKMFSKLQSNVNIKW